ncbi:hypothetical protein BCR32DRAFT_275068 [Anaeromyces robustus]|uniref:Chitin-binding type-1 domain-containing protein n=1 Tax=Anaeromyces robustus TaxID=1754192 RepID=A0A1Y1XLX0_9FUNG|nr:hypothetical protein BCR32DRAFT_275068 [Anaeromyces robustus]|eukprot:ORX86721.1 hypothetical protein BCR32DRAFT_275068 [Anaeromyces robustus]
MITSSSSHIIRKGRENTINICKTTKISTKPTRTTKATKISTKISTKILTEISTKTIKTTITKRPISIVDGRCGSNYGLCRKSNECCSKYNYCGSSKNAKCGTNYNSECCNIVIYRFTDLQIYRFTDLQIYVRDLTQSQLGSAFSGSMEVSFGVGSRPGAGPRTRGISCNHRDIQKAFPHGIYSTQHSITVGETSGAYSEARGIRRRYRSVRANLNVPSSEYDSSRAVVSVTEFPSHLHGNKFYKKVLLKDRSEFT